MSSAEFAEAASSNTPCRRLFIGGLSWDTSDEKFHQYFEQFGAIEEAIIMRDKGTGQSRGFGFVTFVSPEPVQTVLSQSLELDGRQIDPKVAVRKEEMDKRNQASLPPRETTDRKIFVGSISPEVTQESFKAYWETFGGIQEAVVMKGYGFVRFTEQETVEKVLKHPEHIINGHKVEPQRAVHRRSAYERRMAERHRADDHGYGPSRDRYSASSSRWSPPDYHRDYASRSPRDLPPPRDYRERPRDPREMPRDPRDSYDYGRDRYGPYDGSRYDRSRLYESRYAPPPPSATSAAALDPYDLYHFDQYPDFEPAVAAAASSYPPPSSANGRSSSSYYPDGPGPYADSLGRGPPPTSSYSDYGYGDRYASSDHGYAAESVQGSYGRDSYSAAAAAAGGEHGRPSSYSSRPGPGPSRGSRYDPYGRP